MTNNGLVVANFRASLTAWHWEVCVIICGFGEGHYCCPPSHKGYCSLNFSFFFFKLCALICLKDNQFLSDFFITLSIDYSLPIPSDALYSQPPQHINFHFFLFCLRTVCVSLFTPPQCIHFTPTSSNSTFLSFWTLHALQVQHTTLKLHS